MDKHGAVSFFVAVLVAVLAVHVAVCSSCWCYLASSFTSPSPGRIRRKIATLRRFLLLIIIVIIIVIACPRCRRRCFCHHHHHPCHPRPQRHLHPPLLCYHRIGWWCSAVLLFPTVLDIFFGRWLASSLLVLVWFLSPLGFTFFLLCSFYFGSWLR